jgi:hypothetical protein
MPLREIILSLYMSVILALFQHKDMCHNADCNHQQSCTQNPVMLSPPAKIAHHQHERSQQNERYSRVSQFIFHLSNHSSIFLFPQILGKDNASRAQKQIYLYFAEA